MSAKRANLIMTLEHRVEQDKKFYSGSKWRQYYGAFVVSLAVANIGTCWSWTATAIPDINSSMTSPLSPLTSSENSWITAVTYLGAIFVCPIAGLLIQKLGVRASMLTMTLPLIGGWILITFSTTFWMLFVGRFITGFCAGGTAIAVPLFIAETTEAQIRGKLGVGYDLFGALGQLYIFLVGYYVSWQWQAVACGLLPVIFQLLLLSVPETPITLISKQKFEKAQRSLAWFRHAPTLELIQDEFDSMVKTVEISKQGKIKFNLADYLTPSILKPTAICTMVMIFYVTCGSFPIFAYTVEIFKTAGFDDAYLATLIIGVADVVMCLPCAFLVDRVGRRLLLMVSASIMFVSLTVLGGYLYWQVLLSTYNWIPLVCLILFTSGCSVGLAPIAFILVGELIPTVAKGFSSAVVLITSRSLAFIVVYLFNDLNDLLGRHGCYWLFAGSCLMTFCFVYFYVPETKGKSLEEIQSYFQPSSCKRKNTNNNA